MLKKFVSLAVGTACLFSVFGVSAATVTTTTTYKTDGIGVSTKVSDVDAGSTLTYLAHDKSGVTSGENIVYVDQVVLDAGKTEHTFEYVTQYSKIGSTVKVGGRKADASALSVVDGSILGTKIKLNGVAVSDTEFSVEYSEEETDKLVKITSSDFDDIDAITEVKTGETAVSADKYFLGNGCVWIAYSELNKGEAVDITASTSASVACQTVALGNLVGGEDENSAIAVGYVSGNVTEFGIMFASSAEGLTTSQHKAYNPSAESNEGANAFQALGKGSDGLYAVQLYNYSDFIGYGADTVYAAAYYVKDGAVHIGDAFSVSAASTASGAKVSGVSPASLSSIDAEEPVIEDAVIEDVFEEAADEDVVEDVVGVVDSIDVEDVEDVIDTVE